MRILVTGAYGFIGAHIVAALTASDHEVICAVREARTDTRFPGLKTVACDMARDIHVGSWLSRLDGVNAVVNCVGILREHGVDTFATVHEQAPLALFRTCQQLRIRRVIQISALGSNADGEFIASKHRCDEVLAALDLDWLVLRPSLVYSTRGSYGGTSLLRGLAGLPWVLPLPSHGRQRVQPIAAEDIGAAVVAALARPQCHREVLELVGPEVMTLRDYLLAWRRWLGFGPAWVLTVPSALVRVAATLGEHLGNGPLGQTMVRMLDRGNIGAPHAVARLRECLGLIPPPLLRTLDETPSAVQDRWHARLYFWLPALRVSIGLLWVGSGVVGWLTSLTNVTTAVPASTIPAATFLVFAKVTGTADLLLGVLCLMHWRPRLVLALMLLMLLGYTLGIGILWPAHWLDPFGGLLKNLPLIAALAILLATDERR